MVDLAIDDDDDDEIMVCLSLSEELGTGWESNEL